jgi:hypothetical protein
MKRRQKPPDLTARQGRLSRRSKTQADALTQADSPFVLYSCLARPARLALRAAFHRLPRAAFRAGGRVFRG